MKYGNLKDLQKAVKCGAVFASALKRGAGITARKFDIDRVLEWHAKNPNFRTDDVYGRSVSDGSLFIPLKTEFFEAFVRGEKTDEYRVYGKRWNEKTCRVGRAVVLSKGYGKTHRRRGTITAVQVDKNPQRRPGWVECYGKSRKQALCITIKLDQPTA